MKVGIDLFIAICFEKQVDLSSFFSNSFVGLEQMSCASQIR